jgi:hypothetical protein
MSKRKRPLLGVWVTWRSGAGWLVGPNGYPLATRSQRCANMMAVNWSAESHRGAEVVRIGKDGRPERINQEGERVHGGR